MELTKYMKTNIPYYIYSLLLSLLLVGGGCHSSSSSVEENEEESFIAFYHAQGDSISVNSSAVRHRALQRMEQSKDSITKHYYLAIAFKTCLSAEKLDSAKQMLAHLEEFVSSYKPSPRLADLTSEVLNMKGNYELLFGSEDSAIYCYQCAYEYSLRGNRRGAATDVLINLADAYQHKSQFDKSASTYRRALFLADSLGVDDAKKTPIYYGLAHTYMALRDFEECDRYYTLAARYYDRMLPFEKNFYLNNRGNSYYYRGDYAEAIRYFKQLEQLIGQYPETEFQTNLCWLNLSDCFLHLMKPDSASFYLDRCEPFFQRIQLPAALYYIATQRMGLALMQDNYLLARRYLEKSPSDEGMDQSMVQIRNQVLERYFEGTGDYRKAYNYLKKNVQLDDSVRNERVRMRSADLALRYQQDSTLLAKNMLIQQQRTHVLQLQKNQLIWLSLIITIAFVAILYYLYNKRRRLRQQQEAQRMVSAMRLENMRNRMSPHFIFNVLSQHLNGCNEHEQQELMGLVKLMRRNLELAEQLCVTLHEELDFVKTYIALERKSLGEDFESSITIDPSLQVESLQLPSMMIQIPVENAIKHALRGKQGAKRLWIQIAPDESPQGVERFFIEVTDNGGGFRVQSTHRGTGTGLKVVMQTVQLLNRSNKQPIEVAVDDVISPQGENGCRVRISIPQKFNYKI